MPWAKKTKTKREIREYSVMQENENITKFVDTTWEVLMEKITTVRPYIRKEEISQNNNFSFHLKKLEKVEQIKYKVIIRKEVRDIFVEISEIKNRKTTEKHCKTKSWFFNKT